MVMTAEEQIEMLNLIKQCEKLNKEKTDLMEEIVLAAQAVAKENAALRIENERLQRHLSIAEGAIQRLNSYKEESTDYPNSACKAHD